ncbi:putative olfactory receptor 13C6 [Tenrec ecaudatus]|uniref:putative olfactory receptor 13C6 n=1 Tax=Tenrec ecaudatus TaxID=94439 RepID=UPI003F59D1C8
MGAVSPRKALCERKLCEHPFENVSVCEFEHVNDFVLLGLSRDRRAQVGLFLLFGAAYLLTLLGNGLKVLLTGLDLTVHLPMYFFLGHLSMETKTISFTQWGVQCPGTEFLLLAAMTYDHYVAVCGPLRSPATDQ